MDRYHFLQTPLSATNDENEGALGSFRKLIQQQPQLTMQGYNGLTMFFRNNMQLFMEAKFTTNEDYKFLHKLARETGSGEQAWRKAGVDHHDDKQHRLLEKRKKRQDQMQKMQSKLQELPSSLIRELSLILKAII